MGRNTVLEAMEAAIPIKAGYVAEGAERDDRLRDILKLAANSGTTVEQVPDLAERLFLGLLVFHGSCQLSVASCQ